VGHGVAALQDCLATARPWPIKGIIDPAHLLAAVDLLYTEGLRPGLFAGWPSVNPFYRVRPGEVTVITGVPGHGKSAWLAALAVNLARQHGWRIGAWSPEHFPLERYVAVLLELYTGKPFSDTGGGRLSWHDLGNGMAWLQEHFAFLMPAEDDRPTVAHLLTLAKALVYRRGIQGLILDPWNEIEHSRPEGMTETEYISQALSQLRRFARHHSVHIWIVAHPYKLIKATKGPYEGKYAPPTPYEIAGSAHWRNKADNCLAVWRDAENDTPEVELHVQKVRYRENGKPGVAVLRFDPSCGRYTDPVPQMYLPPSWADALDHGDDEDAGGGQ
jgi:twinkle protein